MPTAQRGRFHRAASARIAAPLAVVAVLSVAGGVATTRAAGTDRHRAAERRAERTGLQVRSALDRARTFAVALGSAIEDEPVPDRRRFATLEGNATAAVGLTTALWIEAVTRRDRQAYERRIGSRIITLPGARGPAGSEAFLPATFVTGVQLPRGTDLSGLQALAATLRDPTSVFAGTATSIATFAGRRGFFVVQGGRFGRGAGSRGFLVVFVPTGWLGLSLTEDVRRVAISLEGRRLEGGLRGTPETGTGFEALTRRWRVDVDAEPATAVQATLPWVAVLWLPATALIAYLVGRAIVRRRRAERLVDDVFDISLDLLCVVGLDGWFKRVNPAFEATLGYTGRELLARRLVQFVHPDDRTSMQVALEAVETGAQPGHFVNRFLRSDGAVRWLQWSARALPERGLIYAAARDVTDNRILAEEQAALRRVATLVAEGHDPAELFEAVAGEVGQLLAADATRLLRYEHGDSAAVVAGYGPSDPELDVGAHLPFERAECLLEAGAASAVSAPIVVSGRNWGVIVAAFKQPDAVRPATEARMAQFTELVATAIANAQNGAELTASRRRIAETADETRRRIERDLHDGAQQRLVHTILTLKLARSKLEQDDGRTAELVGEGLAHAEQAIAEIRELARGIHPAILTDRGLVKALRALVQRSIVPVTLEAHIDGRLPEPVEVTVYYVVSEALTNVAKHAQATRVQVTLEERGSELLLCISDDGIGGADPSRGSGLVGLKDRVEAWGGTLTVVSHPDAGTRLDIAIPLRAAEPAVRG
ncbi:PAS domain S-box protein [Solirubrobacter ginsenosidimutans]|uniref:histidine kinase n=1 Tax=Solirubrobacter ginsenosidimutans TaxID=490573 RepID=A0A9X3MU40_9ACTN|nr:PAS domain S-box protein [Solirubrobacter ginsenosidimutans]MDA0162624.1 PAS domain S-box protein [Solirubrobacter ginsenosidimutans]